MEYRKILLFFLFVLISFIVYANSINNEFVFDDVPLIVKNHQVKQLSHIPDLLGLKGSRPYYRPLRMISYALDYQLFKLEPEGYHISNIIFHSITSWLLFLIALRLFKSQKTAIAVTLFFIVHPVNTECVAYISGRRDILSALFYLLGFYLFLQYRTSPKKILIPCIFVSFLCGISSKEMAVTLPALFFLYDFIFNVSGDGGAPEQKLQHKNFFAGVKCVITRYPFFYGTFFAGAVMFTIYKTVIAPATVGHGFYGGHLWTNFLTVARVIIHYLKILFLPVHLNADYSFNAFPVTESFLDVSAWGAVAALGFLLWVSIKAFRKNRMITFSLLWFFLTLLPVCHIVPHHELLAEHYLYLPSIGILLLMGTVFRPFLHNKCSWAFAASFGIILLLFSLRTIERNKDWKNAFTLWEKTVITAPECARAWNNLGVEYETIEEGKKAEKAYKQALGIKPSYPDPYHNLGNMLADQLLFDEAIEHYTKAFHYGHRNSRKKVLNSMGVVYRKKGELDVAQHLFFIALKNGPFYSEARNNLATVYYSQGDFKKAHDILIWALEIDPLSPEIHNNLGNVYKKTGSLEMAVEEFEKAIDLNNDFMEAHNNLGNVFKALEQYEDAIEEFQTAIRLKPDSAEVYINLGNTLRKVDRDEEAEDVLLKAVELNPDIALAHQNLALIYLSKIKDEEKALFHLERTLECDPLIPQARAIKEKISELEDLLY